MVLEYCCWYTANTLNRSVFDVLSIGSVFWRRSRCVSVSNGKILFLFSALEITRVMIGNRALRCATRSRRQLLHRLNGFKTLNAPAIVSFDVSPSVVHDINCPTQPSRCRVSYDQRFFSTTSNDSTANTTTESPTQQTHAFLTSLGYSTKVSDGIINALLQNGIQPSSLLSMVKALAGRYEVDEDAGLEALAASVKIEIEKQAGKSKIKVVCLPPTAWSPALDEDDIVEQQAPTVDSMDKAFVVEALEGTTLTDVVKFGTGGNNDVLGEYLDCACAGIMACSTCHVVIHPDWFDDTISPADDHDVSMRGRMKKDDSSNSNSNQTDKNKIGPPSEAEQDMLDLAYEPQITSR